MKYYLIAGEASGDLHASHLMRSLQSADPQAEFRFVGGDMMQAVGGTCVHHYRKLAYMGFVPVLLHLHTIMHNMAMCKDDIKQWQPDAVILVDYPGFNLRIAHFVKSHTDIRVFYYISPKIWAWKEWRIKAIKRDVDAMFSILPFEVAFYEQKHNYPIHYVGNPTADEVRIFKASYAETFDEFTSRHNLSRKPIIALLAGSRRQEILDNLPAMIAAASRFHNYQLVIAGAPSIDKSLYCPLMQGKEVSLVPGDTYALISHATLAVVTSGTATLETALFGVPQVVCYKTPLPRFIAFCRRHVLKVKYISLVNLIADEEIVTELVADTFSSENIAHCLSAIMPGEAGRQRILDGYKKVHALLGEKNAADNAARSMKNLLECNRNHNDID